MLLLDELLPREDSYIWINKKIKIFVGLSSIIDDEIKWFYQGKFIVNNPRINYSITEKTIELEGLDYMSLLDGKLGGTLNARRTIKEGVCVNDAIQGFMNTSNFPCLLEENIYKIPYEMEKEATSTVYEFLQDINNLYMGQEIFVDKNGYFVCQRIKKYKTDMYCWDFSDLKLVVDYGIDYNFDNIRNHVYLWGMMHEDGTQTKYELKNQSDGEFCIDKIGDRDCVIKDEKIFTDEQAKLKCEYELEKRNNYVEKLRLTVLPVYMLEPNQVILFKRQRWLIDDINFGLKYDSLMNLNCHKIY